MRLASADNKLNRHATAIGAVSLHIRCSKCPHRIVEDLFTHVTQQRAKSTLTERRFLFLKA